MLGKRFAGSDASPRNNTRRTQPGTETPGFGSRTRPVVFCSVSGPASSPSNGRSPYRPW